MTSTGLGRIAAPCMSLGQLLHAARFAKRLTLRDVAAMTGVSISTLSRIERDGEGEFGNVALFVDAVGADPAAVIRAAVKGKEATQ